MGVDHRRAHVLVAQELLEGPNVIAILEQVHSNGVDALDRLGRSQDQMGQAPSLRCGGKGS